MLLMQLLRDTIVFTIRPEYVQRYFAAHCRLNGYVDGDAVSELLSFEVEPESELGFVVDVSAEDFEAVLTGKISSPLPLFF